MIKKKSKLIQLTQEDGKALRELYWKKQNKKCAILNKRIPYANAVLDHKHMTRKEVKELKHGIDGKGLCRGVLDYRVNSFEGDVLKKYKKRGLKDEIPLTILLRRLADYIDNPTIPQIYIHYKEKPKAKTFGKKEYNKICKYYFKLHPKARKIPEFPKSGIKIVKGGKRKGKKIYKAKLTKKWENLLDTIKKEFNK